jgi:transposase-like protein
VIIDDTEVAPCPICDGGHGEQLGYLGSRLHFRCRRCGIEFSQTRPTTRDAPGGGWTFDKPGHSEVVE